MSSWHKISQHTPLFKRVSRIWGFYFKIMRLNLFLQTWIKYVFISGDLFYQLTSTLSTIHGIFFSNSILSTDRLKYRYQPTLANWFVKCFSFFFSKSLCHISRSWVSISYTNDIALEGGTAGMVGGYVGDGRWAESGCMIWNSLRINKEVKFWKKNK